MIRLGWYFLLLLVVGLGILTVGCSDDDCPICPDDESDSFEIVLTCVDEAGQPLANVSVGAMSALPESVWPFAPNSFLEKSRAAIDFELAEPLRVKVLIRDVERNLVDTISEEHLVAGPHRVTWTGRYEDNNVHTPAGYYEAVLLVDEGEELGWAAVDSIGLYQAAFDVGQFSFGTTDSNGKIRLTDRRMVPAFYDHLPISITNESEELLGQMPLTTTTWLNCQSQGGRSGWGVLDAVDGIQEITVVLNENTEDSTGPAGLIARPAVAPQAGPKDARAAFGYAYPNPFN
jgi:hypothetical protein